MSYKCNECGRTEHWTKIGSTFKREWLCGTLYSITCTTYRCQCGAEITEETEKMVGHMDPGHQAPPNAKKMNVAEDPADNKRLCVMAAVTPQKRQCEIGL